MDIPRFSLKVRHAVGYMLVCVCLVVLLYSLFSKYYFKGTVDNVMPTKRSSSKRIKMIHGMFLKGKQTLYFLIF